MTFKSGHYLAYCNGSAPGSVEVDNVTSEKTNMKIKQMRPRCEGGMSKPSGFPRKNVGASKNGFKNLVFF